MTQILWPMRFAMHSPIFSWLCTRPSKFNFPCIMVGVVDVKNTLDVVGNVITIDVLGVSIMV